MRRILAVGAAFAALGLFMSCNATFTGRVAVKGNEPFTYLALVTRDQGELSIVGNLAAEIRAKYQNRLLTVEGTITHKAEGPGFPATLVVTRIVKVE